MDFFYCPVIIIGHFTDKVLMAEIVADAIRQLLLVFYDQDLHEKRISSKFPDKNVEILKRFS
jgi:hypothetical protein